MAANILSQYKRKISDLKLIPDGGGCFEVKVGDKLVYSKLATGEFPDEMQVTSEVGELL